MATLLLLVDVALAIFAAGIVAAIVRSALYNRNTAGLIESTRVLAERGWAGYRVELDLGERELKLVAPRVAPEGIALFLSSRPNAAHPPGLTLFDFGNALDGLLPVRAGSDQAIAHLRLNLGRLSLIGPLIRAHGHALALDVGSNGVTLFFRGSFFARGLPLRQVQQLLPKVVAALDELLHAAWDPPAEGVVAGEGPFRGAAGAAAPPADLSGAVGAGRARRFLRFAQNPVYFVIAALAFCLPAMSVHCGASQVVQGRASADWPAVAGEVVSSRIRKETSRGSGGYYRAMISYRYEVNGQPYQGDRLRFVADARRDLTTASESFGDRQEAEFFLRRYPRGSRVPVYYDPADPARAVLIKGEVRGQEASIIVGAIVSSLGMLYLLLALVGRLWRLRLQRAFAARLEG